MDQGAFSRKVLLIGSSREGDAAAEALSRLGLEPVRLLEGQGLEGLPQAYLATSGHQVLSNAVVTDLQGQPGRYNVGVKSGERLLQLEVGAVIITTGCDVKEPFLMWGTAPSADVLSLLSIEKIEDEPLVKRSAGKGLGVALFVCGFCNPSHPVLLEKAARQAIRLRALGAREVYIATDHLKVASRGLERLLGKARDEGVIFLRSALQMPMISRGEGGLEVQCLDEALGEVISLRPDLLILEDVFVPWSGGSALASALGIGLDRAGFFQGDCVHEFPIFTNRTGVFVIGSAKGPISEEKALEEAEAASLEAARLLLETSGTISEKIELDRKKCTICLTCYRLCPHRAISYLNRRPVFYPIACKGCGICAAECPMDAIQLIGSRDLEIKGRIKEALGAGASMLVFACRRSGMEAASGLEEPRSGASGITLVEVPCAGRLDPDLLFTAFRYGALGVMVLACHHGSCRSVEGSLFAEGRASLVKRELREMGVREERLFFGTIAPMETKAFSRIVREFEEGLKEDMLSEGKDNQ
jgi:coenzyme F420-reducing hydrogenase delta subunit/Pyruvate/2-oxoacid:ferredoxin oxidoreductase delta subunit